MFSALPLFLGVVIAPFFFPHGLGTPITTGFSLLLAALFGVALGVKNLILIHRTALLNAAAYVFSYIILLLFFMQAGSASFLHIWLFAVLALWLAFCLLIADYRLALALALLLGELIWIVSWLPIGFLNSASIGFTIILFAGDAMQEKRISGKNTIIAIALIILLFSTSHFAIQ